MDSKNTAVIIKVDGTEVPLDCKRAPTLEQAQAAVGGYVQMVAGRHPVTGVVGQMLVDEEGLLKRKIVNASATMYCLGHILVGDALWLTGNRRWT